MSKRLFVIGYYCLLNSVIYFGLSFAVPQLVAVNIAMILTIAVFLSSKKHRDRNILKRPEVFIK